MGNSWRIATIFGIPIRLHWTLGLFFLFFIWFGYQQALGLESLLVIIGFIVSLFICILLHEFGHSLTAKRYGVQTRDIILSPIGGLARLENIPDKPIQEFKVAINGPIVNLIIASILAIILLVFNLPFLPDIVDGVVSIGPNNFIQWLMYMNIGVFLFNLIPAFPMDGGRILRSLLSIKIGRSRATFWASLLGKILAIAFAVYAVYAGYFMLLIIGPFVYFMAGQEYRQVLLSELMKETKIGSIIRETFTKVNYRQTIPAFLESIAHTDELSFLVYDEHGNILGSLPVLFVDELRKQPEKYNTVGDIASDKYKILEADNSIDEAFQIMKTEGIAIVGVVEKEKVVGVVDRTTISKFIFENSKRGIL